MPSDPADRASQTGHPRAWVAGLVLLLVVAGLGAFWLLRDGTTAVLPTPSENAASQGAESRGSAASALLREMETVLTDGTRRDALALAAPRDTARQSINLMRRNVQALDIEDLSLRYVDEGTARLSQDDRDALGPRAWVADVEMEWRIGGLDDGTSEMEVSFAFVDTADGLLFGDAGGDYGNPAPLWVLDRLAVERSEQALVMVAERRRADRYATMAEQAVTDVQRVLPRWEGGLVVEVPRSQEQLDTMLDATEGTYDAIAAITTTVDGTMRPGSPTHIMVNPRVFHQLGDRGAQIVMSHEATHVATDAAAASMPMWLLEGFADYVALDGVDVPVSVAASQILEEVRRDGPPDQLPGGTRFDPSHEGLGATYEAAWLATKLVAETYGERKLVRFYDAVDGGEPVEQAFRRVLGTDQRTFTREWQDHLRQLAS